MPLRGNINGRNIVVLGQPDGVEIFTVLADHLDIHGLDGDCALIRPGNAHRKAAFGAFVGDRMLVRYKKILPDPLVRRVGRPEQQEAGAERVPAGR